VEIEGVCMCRQVVAAPKVKGKPKPGVKICQGCGCELGVANAKRCPECRKEFMRQGSFARYHKEKEGKPMLRTCACGKPCRLRMCLDCSNLKQRFHERNRRAKAPCLDCGKDVEGFTLRCLLCKLRRKAALQRGYTEKHKAKAYPA
jgi:hypothetical protein